MSTQDQACKLCRLEGDKLFLKGARCFTPKCSFERRAYAPGMHGEKVKRPNKRSEFAIRLREKQRTRRFYGLSERQFQKYFWKSSKSKGATGVQLLQLLEQRLDNVIYRMGLAASRSQARQFVNHGHILVNGRKVNIPSYTTKPGEQISIKESAKAFMGKLIEEQGERTLPEWLEFSKDNFLGKILAQPNREQIDAPVQEQLIVEYYS